MENNTCKAATVEQGTLDVGIWGRLQDYIPLQIVYEKLPYRDFFRSRVVCKVWNRVASERLEPKPYFVTIAYAGNDYLNGILNYDIASGKWSWARQHFIMQGLDFRRSDNLQVPFAVEGLIFSYYPYDMRQQAVFNVHSKMWHVVPPAPKFVKGRVAMGIVVDTCVRPHTFKLVLGSTAMETQVYDSKSGSWSTRTSRLMTAARSRSRGTSCMCTNGYMYISQGMDLVLMYSLEGDIWTTLKEAPLEFFDNHWHSLGTWQGRIFTTRRNYDTISVWELVHPAKEEWVEYARSSQDMFVVLKDCDVGDTESMECDDEFSIETQYCNEYLLIYGFYFLDGEAYERVLFNLATKEWEKLDLPVWSVELNP